MVDVPIPKEKWSGKIGEVTLGATSENGGTRSNAIKTGGESGMPFLSYEGAMPNRPLIAGEVLDSTSDLPDPVKAEFGGATDDPVDWARAWVERHGADLICIKLVSTSPDEANRTPHVAAETVKRLLPAEIAFPVCDMETFPLVETARQRQLPFLGVRSITDRADEEIPRALLKVNDASGSYRFLRAVFLLLSKPRLIPAAIRLGRRGAVASENLWRAFEAVVRIL